MGATDECAELHLRGATARYHVCSVQRYTISSSDFLLLVRFLHDHDSVESRCLKLDIEPEFLLLVSAVMYVILLSSPSPSPVANVRCVGGHHTTPLPSDPHPFTFHPLRALPRCPHPRPLLEVLKHLRAQKRRIELAFRRI